MAAGEIIAFGWIGSALYTAVIGQNKNRSGCLWLALGLALGPLGLLISALIPAAPPIEPAEEEAAEEAEGDP